MTATLFEFHLLSWWRVGTGEALSGHVDTLCARDGDGFPFIPAKQVRGLFREAVRDAEELNWIAAGSAAVMFGSRARGDETELSPDTDAGALRFESAVLPNPERSEIAKSDRVLLFSRRQSTAMEGGVAKEKTLRSDEIALPVSLVASVEPIASFADRLPEDWRARLMTALPLIRAIGQKRTRGLGRCSVRMLAEGVQT